MGEKVVNSIWTGRKEPYSPFDDIQRHDWCSDLLLKQNRSSFFLVVGNGLDLAPYAGHGADGVLADILLDKKARTEQMRES